MASVTRPGSPPSLLVLWTALLFLISTLAPAQSQALLEKSERGKELMAEHKFAEAVPVYRELVQAVPDNPGLLLNLGMALHLAGYSHEAIAPLEHAIKLDPGILPAWLFLGASYLSAGDAKRFTSTA